MNGPHPWGYTCPWHIFHQWVAERGYTSVWDDDCDGWQWVMQQFGNEQDGAEQTGTLEL